MKIKISTYTEGQQLPAHHFFILNKGLNSGKPGDVPWRNSFVASFETVEERDHYYWLCYGLWITQKFRYNLIGSVIPFIRKHDLLQIIEMAECRITGKQEMFHQAVFVCIEAQQHSLVMKARIDKLQQAKVAILQHFITL